MPDASAEAVEAPRHASLREALLSFQSEATAISKDKSADTGSYVYKYLSLDRLLEEVLPKLSERDLLWRTWPTVLTDGSTPALGYALVHVPSGGEQAGLMPLMLKPGGGNPQDLGKAISYARRYALVTVLNIGQPDEDGQVSTTQGGGSTQGVKRLTEAKAKKLAEAADMLPAPDRANLQLAATHIRGGEDVGDCSTTENAVKAIKRLDAGQGERLAKWIKDKAAAAVGDA